MSAASLPLLARALRCALCALLATCAGAQAAEPVVVGSKRFTESYILGELARQVPGAGRRAGAAPAGPGQHRR
jgi:osmoprotectant transport system permease protein